MQPNTHTRPRAVSGVGLRDRKVINGDVSTSDFFRHGVTRANTLVPLGEPTRHSSHDTVCMVSSQPMANASNAASPGGACLGLLG